jgi:hypothetical protein
MRIYNRYLIILAVIFCIIDIVLASFNLQDISAYFIGNVIAYLVVTLLFVHFNHQARRALSVVSVILLTGFGFIAAVKIMDILTVK